MTGAKLVDEWKALTADMKSELRERVLRLMLLAFQQGMQEIRDVVVAWKPGATNDAPQDNR